ncbi:peptidoglycan DD-metalloendopeptidase family protein [Alkalihalobacterium bogoriense]|uniref:peptidoglycan DD-metalloendopeptidase family protein n=1 Tax=Alkalihalobacterium bogoriense TaxID=246272 RepID=UPI00047BC04F|nr:peptidoglycan DD-metalloendopeptidase family protein [Alkalihalobacterium bogoriense]
MRRKLSLVVVAGAVAVGTILPTSGYQIAFANSELQKQIQDIQSEREETKKEAAQKEAELAKVEEEQQQVRAEIEKLDHEVADTNEKIEEKNEEIEEVSEHIKQLEEEIKILEERIAERDELLKERARSMYQNGGSISYLEVILGSKSFGDFLDRVSALSMIAQQDRNILDAHIADQLQLEETKALVEEQLAKLEEKLLQLEELMEKLEAQKKEKDKKMNQLIVLGEDLHADLGELEGMDEILRLQEQAAKKELAAWQERERQAELERQRQQQELSSRGSGSGSGNGGSNNNNGSTGETPAATSGTFQRPASGRVSSPFGMRTHPVYGGQRLHAGMDIANSTGTPIVAAEAGTVIVAEYRRSFGNTVMISHVVNGKSVTTLYAHLNSIHVSSGDSVSRGQQIGTMGATGTATGPHLHFEVHPGGYRGASSAVNPANYLN